MKKEVRQMGEERRMAGDYEIKQSFRIGDYEVVYGENPDLDQPYFCALYKKEWMIICYRERYEDCVVSDSYLEIMEVFAGRVQAQCEKMREELARIAVPTEPVTADMCYPNDSAESLEGRVAAIKKSVFRPEYQRADQQLVLVTGGDGARKNSRGTACYCTNLYTGEDIRWERYDIQGEVKPECLPEWARERFVMLQKARAEKKKEECER